MADDVFAAATRKAQRLIEVDGRLREYLPKPEALDFLREGGHLAIEYIAKSCQTYKNRPCLGARDDSPQSPFVPVSYGQLWERIALLATGLSSRNLVRQGDFVGICGFASIDWVVADLALLYLGASSVPLQPSMSSGDLLHVADECELTCLMCGTEQLQAMTEVIEKCRTLETLIIMDERVGAPSIHTASTISEIETSGRGAELAPFARHNDPDPLVTVSYTSGSTGRPKGVMYPESRWLRRIRIALEDALLPQITVGYLPLCHVAGRFSIYRSLVRGGLTNFVAKSDMSTLLEDIRSTRPTTMTFVPRVTGMIYQHFQSELVRRGQTREQEVIDEMRDSFLGDRLCVVSTGGGTTAPEVLTFFERCFQASVINSYGLNELGAITVNDRIYSGVTYKLEDVPELGYSTGDRPYPRGELLAKTTHPSPGYYKNPGASEQMRDSEGYVRTGDIVEERGRDHIVLIDRKQNVLKLAQGEFVSMSRLEDLYQANSPFIAQIHLYGNSARAFLLAVIVPSVEDPDGAALKKRLRNELDRVARAARLPSHEVPRDFLVELQPFTRENGLLTELNKPKRPALKLAYGARLEAMYERIAARQVLDARALATLKSASVPERTRAAIAATLGLAIEDVDIDDRRQTFIGLGGDSLSAVRLSAFLVELCGASPPVGALLGPSASLSAIARNLERLSGAGAADLSFATIHGDKQQIDATDLRLDRFLRDQPMGERATHEPRAVLLTGANGFLGRFLLVELLEHASRRGGEVVCVVRGADDASARARLLESYANGGPELKSDQLTVYAGDLMQPKLGLSDPIYDQLAERIDAVVHNGALVNHALSYPQLFEPNVLGTVEIMRFALARRLKAINFVSSAGVVAGLGRATPIFEDEDPRVLFPSRAIGAGESDYGIGYAATKWASELLLRQLFEQRAVPVNIFRCTMILGHRKYAGQINENDNIARLLYGVVATGLAPESFYAPAHRSQRHFDGLPVDFVAQAIAAIALQGADGAHTYHVSNSQWDDGISLDRVIDWVQSAGYKIIRVPSHAEWFEQFKARLELLDDAKKKRSPLPLINRWQHPIGERSILKLDSSRFIAKLAEVDAKLRIPVLDEEFIHHSVAWLASRRS